MDLCPYVEEIHLPQMQKMLRARNLPLSLADELPSIGYVASLESKAIAMGFLRRLENAKSVLIDSLITHPEASAELRNEANDRITELLIATAQRMKMNQVLASTVDANTKERALKHGFVHLPHLMMSLSLLPGGERK